MPIIPKTYLTIKNNSDLNKLKAHLTKYNIIAIDTETTGLNVRKDKVIGVSFCGKEGEAYYFPIYEYSKESDTIKRLPLYSEIKPILLSFLDDLSGKRLIMHNASYDIRIIENSLGINLLPALYADTQLLKHTVDEEGSFKLKEIAVALNKEIGLDPSEQANQEQLDLKQHIKEKGGIITQTKFEIYKADIDFLSPYACADADYTLRLFNYYSKLLKLENLENFFYKQEVMPLFKYVTIEMEKNGLQLDIPLMLETKKEIETHLIDIEDQIQKELKPYSEDLKTIILDKQCPLKPTGRLAKKLVELYKLNIPLTKLGSPSLTAKNLEALQGDLDVVKFLKTGDYSLSFRSKLEDIREQVVLESTGEKYLINIGSNDQLSQIFFETLCETPENTTPTGKPKLDDAALEKLAKKYKAAELIQVYRGLVKIKSTYIDRFLEAQEDGLFYPSFKQFGTISGRYGSDMQQLPKVIEEDAKDKTHPLIYKYTNLVRAFFIAKPNMNLISADYSALEVRVFADDAGDEPLLDVFRNGEDIYSKVAIQVNKLEGQYSADKNDENFLKNKLPTLRQISKCFDKDTKVETKNGWKDIINVVIGDEIRTSKGWKKVLNITERTSKTGLFVTNKGILKVTPDHKIWNKTKNDWEEASKFKEKDLIDINEYLELQQGTKQILPIWSNANYRNVTRYEDGQFSATKPLSYLHFDPEWAYILGAYYGDGIGNYTKRKEVGTRTNYNGHLISAYIGICGLKEDLVVEKWKTLVEKLGYHVIDTVRKGEAANKKDLQNYYVRDFEFVKIFQGTFKTFKDGDGLTGAKNLKIPEFVFNSTIEDRLAFIAGLIDTDGYAKLNVDGIPQMNFCSKDYRLITDFVTLVSTLGISCTISTEWNKTYQKYYYIARLNRFGIQQLSQLGIYKYLACPRKKQAFDLIDNYIFKKSKEHPANFKLFIEESEQQVYDITVEDVHEFYAGNIRVHNCYTLGIRYGLKSFKLAHDLKMSEELCIKTVETYVGNNSEKFKELTEENNLETLFDWQLLAADCIVDSYFQAFPKLKEAMDRYKKQAVYDGRVISPYGRVKHMGEAVKIYKRFGESILDPKKSKMLASKYYLQFEEIQTLRKRLSGMINTAYNFPIQSAAASIVNRAAIEVNKQLTKAKIKGKVIMQVHDELLIEVEEDKTEEAKKIVQKAMENTTKLKYLDLVAEPESGKCYRDIH